MSASGLCLLIFAVCESFVAEWLAEYGSEYAGQSVALDGYSLIAQGLAANENYAVAGASKVKYPNVTQVEDPDAPSFGGL